MGSKLSVRIQLAILALVVAYGGTGAAQNPTQVPIRSDGPIARELRSRAALSPAFEFSEPDLPAHFKTVGARRFDNSPVWNPTTDSGAMLGRFLFYDTQLSVDGTMSCASCHQQAAAFGDRDRFSRGPRGVIAERKTMGLGNLRYQPHDRFFRDERVDGLESAVLMSIESEIGLGLGDRIEVAVDAIGQDESYARLFEQAFGSASVTRGTIARAIAQFLRSMVSYRSRFDEGLAGVADLRDDFSNFNAGENRGKLVFLRNCASCHLPLQNAHFQVLDAMSNGLDEDLDAVDGGLGDVTLRAADIGRFKATSLRNIEVKGPYMHDGRFATLEAVIEHYSSGVLNHPNLGGGGLRRFRFVPEEKRDLLAFLKTLTDHHFLSDPEFSNPYFVDQQVKTADEIVGADQEVDRLRAWLARFDHDGDGCLDPEELSATFPALEAQGFTRGLRGRFGFEARDARLVGLLDRGRAETVDRNDREIIPRLHRALAAMPLLPGEARTIIDVLERHRERMTNESRADRKELLRSIRKVLGRARTLRFEERLLELRNSTVALRRRLAEVNPMNAADLAETLIIEFDRDADGRLSGVETRAFAVHLASAPGGFDPEGPRYRSARPIEMPDLRGRLLVHDRDGDGRLSRAELPGRLLGLLEEADLDGDDRLDMDELNEVVAWRARESLKTPPPVGIDVAGSDDGALSPLRVKAALDGLELDPERHRRVIELVEDACDPGCESCHRVSVVEEVGRVLGDDRLREFEELVREHDSRVSEPRSQACARRCRNAVLELEPR